MRRHVVLGLAVVWTIVMGAGCGAIGGSSSSPASPVSPPTSNAMSPTATPTFTPAPTVLPAPLTPPSPPRLPTATLSPGEEAPLPGSQSPGGSEKVFYQNDVIGVRLLKGFPQARVTEDQYLSDAFGFTVVDSEGGMLLRVAWRYRDAPAQMEQRVRELAQGFPGLGLEPQPVRIGPYQGYMVAGVPGMDAGVYFYVAAYERLYEIICTERVGDVEACKALLESSVSFSPAARSPESLGLKKADEVLYGTPSPGLPTPVPKGAMTSTPSPTATPTRGKPTPLLPPTATLPPGQEASLQLYELPEVGLRIQIPAEWEMLRRPGGYIFAAGGEYRVNVTSCCEELPHTVSELQEALAPYYRDVYHEEDVKVVLLEGPHWQGVGVWPQSNPEVCLDVYIPTQEIIRQISLFSVFCEPGKEKLVPLGERILDSIEIFAPSPPAR